MRKRFLGRQTQEKDASKLRPRIFAATTPSGSGDHGTLGGLGDDDHPQYAAIAQNETITGAWTFNNAAGVTITQGGLDVTGTLDVQGDVGFTSTNIDTSGAWDHTGDFEIDGNLTLASATGTLRLTNTNDVGLSSTNHAFQIGPDAGQNLAMDANEIMSRNNGAVSNLFLNNDGGRVYIANGAGSPQLQLGSNSNANNSQIDIFGNNATAFTIVMSGSQVFFEPDTNIRIEAQSGTNNYLKFYHSPGESFWQGLQMQMSGLNDAYFIYNHLTTPRWYLYVDGGAGDDVIQAWWATGTVIAPNGIVPAFGNDALRIMNTGSTGQQNALGIDHEMPDAGGTTSAAGIDLQFKIVDYDGTQNYVVAQWVFMDWQTAGTKTKASGTVSSAGIWSRHNVDHSLDGAGAYYLANFYAEFYHQDSAAATATISGAGFHASMNSYHHASATLTYSSLYGFRSAYGNYPTKVTNAYHLFGTNIYATNAYGLYFEDITGGSTANYAIYTKAGNILFNAGNNAGTDLQFKGGIDNLFWIDSGLNVVSVGALPLADWRFYAYLDQGNIAGDTGSFMSRTQVRNLTSAETSIYYGGRLYALGSETTYNINEITGGETLTYINTLNAGGYSVVRGGTSRATISDGNTVSITTLIGHSAWVDVEDATVGTARGHTSQVYVDDGSITSWAIGHQVYSLVISGAGDVANVAGLYISDPGNNEAGVTGATYGIFFEQHDSASSGGDAFALYIGDVNSTSGTPYAMYQAGGGRWRFNDNIYLGAATGTTIFTTNTGRNLTFDIYGDIILDPNPTGGSSSGNVLPGGSVEDDFGDWNRQWRTGYLAELWVQVITAQDVQATIGGYIRVAPTAQLDEDFLSADTTLSLDSKYGDVFDVGDYLLMQGAPGATPTPQFEVVEITVDSGGGDYTVTRDEDGSGANNWYIGDAIVNLGGAAGEGYIDLVATNTAFDHLGPAIVVYVRTATTNWNDMSATVAMGNLESFLDYSVDEFGFATGNDLTASPSSGNFDGVSIDRTNGIRIWNADLTMYDGATATIKLNPGSSPYFSLGGSGYPTAFSTGIGVWMGDDGGTYKFRVGDPGGRVFSWDGVDVIVGTETAEHIEIDSTSLFITTNDGTTKYFEVNNANVYIGNQNDEHIHVDASKIEMFAGASPAVVFHVDNTPSLWIGESVTTERFAWDATNGLQLYSGLNELVFNVLPGGDMTVGSTAGSHANMFWDTSAGTLNFRAGTGPNQVVVNTSGQVVAGAGDVTLDADGLSFAQKDTGTTNAIVWNRGGIETATIYTNSTDARLYLTTDRTTAGNTSIQLRADGYTSNDYTQIRMFGSSTDASRMIEFNLGGDVMAQWKYDGTASQIVIYNYHRTEIEADLGVTGSISIAASPAYGLGAGVLRVGNEIQLDTDGTTGDPSLTWTNDQDTGVYRIGDNVLGITAGNTKVAEFRSTGIRMGPGGTAGTPVIALDSDTNTGLQWGNADDLFFSAGGVNQFRINTNGRVSYCPTWCLNDNSYDPANITANTYLYSAATDAVSRTIRRFELGMYVYTTNNSSNYWNARVYRLTSAGTLTAVGGTVNTNGNSIATWYREVTTTTGSVLNTDIGLFVYFWKTGSPGQLAVITPRVWLY